MLINLRNALMAGKRLPYDAEVEYLRVDAVGPYIVIDGVTYCNAVGTYYAFTISSGGVVTHDLIPVRLGNTGYMYDRITNKHFGNAGTGDFVLGPDVVPVEYIESHGTEWIDTGFKINTNTDILNTRFLPKSGGSNYEVYFGLRDVINSTSVYYEVRKINTSDRIDLVLKTQGILQADDQWHSLSLGNNSITVDETTSSFTAFNTAFTQALYLFDRNNDGKLANFGANCKMANLEVIRSGAPVLKFRPIRVGTDATSWEGAMIDTLTRRIYRNAGTGAFTYGNDLKYPIPAS